DERHCEVIGDRERVAAKIAIAAEHRAIEDLHPAGSALTMPRERRRLHTRIIALEERENLGVDEAVDELAAHLRIDPVHSLVDPGTGAKRLRIRGRIDRIGDVLEDRRALGEAEIAVLEHG